LRRRHVDASSSEPGLWHRLGRPTRADDNQRFCGFARARERWRPVDKCRFEGRFKRHRLDQYPAQKRELAECGRIVDRRDKCISGSANSLAASTLGPTRKLLSSVVLSRELAEASDAENVFGQLLREDISVSLDFSLLSTAAASSAALAPNRNDWRRRGCGARRFGSA
jgi:hypothetical protein